MSAPTIQTPLTRNDALALASLAHCLRLDDGPTAQIAVQCMSCERIADALMAVDVASRAQAVPDYQRLADLVGATEEATRGTEDVRERLALVDELVEALRALRSSSMQHRTGAPYAVGGTYCLIVTERAMQAVDAILAKVPL